MRFYKNATNIGIKSMTEYFRNSFIHNPSAALLEIVETVLMTTVVVATYIYAHDFGPIGKYIIPAYLVSSILAVISAKMRNSSKIVLYTIYVIFNSAAMAKLFL